MPPAEPGSNVDWSDLQPATETRRWKWGWNAVSGETTIWPVTGMGDGWPTHHDYLTEDWCREPDYAGGDIVGTAESGNGEDADTITVRAFGPVTPAAVLDRFQSEFPNARVQELQPTDGNEP